MTQFARPTPAAADYDSTIIGALELSEKKWVLAVQLPGVNRRWEAVRRCAGLEGLRLYGLRHSSRARALGHRRGLPVAAKLPGHSQAATTPNFIFLPFRITVVRQPL
jgi:hypothetical protein